MSDIENLDKSNGKARLNLELSQGVSEQLDRMAKRHGRSKAELMRLALDLLVNAEEMQDQGYTVGGWKDDTDGPRERVRIIGLP